MIYEEEYNAFEDMDVVVEEFIEVLDKEVTTEWTADDELNARICEASEGMLSLSHTGC